MFTCRQSKNVMIQIIFQQFFFFMHDIKHNLLSFVSDVVLDALKIKNKIKHIHKYYNNSY